MFHVIDEQELSRVERSVDGTNRLKGDVAQLASDRRHSAGDQRSAVPMWTGQRERGKTWRYARALRHWIRVRGSERR